MAIANSSPIRYTPKGLTDAFDATDEFKGAAQSLANLIFDQTNPELVIARPGVIAIVDMATRGFNTPGFICVHATVGTRVYGMVATKRNVGNDEPFCYDTATNSFVPMSGVTSGNTPSSPATSGDWVPPTMASIGKYIIITHPGFSGVGANFYGVIDLSVLSAPVWSSHNLATNALTAVPTAVANLNNRAYFSVANQLPFSDVLDPLTRTNASQQLTAGDTSNITAMAGLPMQTTGSGVLSALTVFKPTSVWQVTGDPTTNTLALNFLSLTTGTNFPRTLAQSSQGVYFTSTGGPYVVDLLGTVRSLVNGQDGGEADIQAAFINAITPSRWAGVYNSSIYRVSGQTIIRGVTQTNDYWFDEKKRRWNGPHSFAYDCASALSGYCILTVAASSGLLIQSQLTPQLASVYTDLGSAYNVSLQTSTFPKVGDMCIKQVAESQIELGGLPTGASYTITAQDELGTTLSSVVINVSLGGLWGGFVWGDGTPWAGLAVWGSVGKWGSTPLGTSWVWTSGQRYALRTYRVPWTEPFVFEKMQLLVEAVASATVAIGTFYARYQKTGYMTLR